VITPNGKTVYVASVGMGSVGSVTPIRTAANKARKAIPVGDSPDALAVTVNGKTVYVVNFTNGPGTARGSVTPIKTPANKAGKAMAWSIPERPQAMDRPGQRRPAASASLPRCALRRARQPFARRQPRTRREPPERSNRSRWRSAVTSTSRVV